MSIVRMTNRDWGELLSLTHGQPDYAKYMGYSPGGAADALGITRQRVWQLCKEGKLDLILLADSPEAKVSAWVVTDASIDRLRKSRPLEQGDLLFGKPRLIKSRVRRLAQARRTRQG